MGKRSSGNNISVGKSALFARHPQMQTWPKDHGFEVHELTLSSIWMIDFYGGGGEVKVSDFLAAKAKHNVPAWPPAWQDDKHHNMSHWHHDGSDWHHNWSHWHNKGSDRHRNRLQWKGHLGEACVLLLTVLAEIVLALLFFTFPVLILLPSTLARQIMSRCHSARQRCRRGSAAKALATG